MPFDGRDNTPAINRARLIEALRQDTEWKWNFCNSSGCAIGMAESIWQIRGLSEVQELLDMTRKEFKEIFGIISCSSNQRRGKPIEWCDYYQKERTQVTPTMVADALEALP